MILRGNDDYYVIQFAKMKFDVRQSQQRALRSVNLIQDYSSAGQHDHRWVMGDNRKESRDLKQLCA